MKMIIYIKKKQMLLLQDLRREPEKNGKRKKMKN